MAISKEKKKEIIKKLDTIKEDSAAVVFVGFNGLDADSDTIMRRKLREEGVGYFVAKKTLLKRSFANNFSGEMPVLEGEIALAYSDDAITPAQNIKAFTKQYKDKLRIVGGVFQGVYKNEEEMTEIASIPPLPVLRGMFVNVINAPLQGLVISLQAIADKKN